jgi:hypothetical protein
MSNKKDLALFKGYFPAEEIETSADRLDEINRKCKEEFLETDDAREKERAFRMFLVTHTVMAADEGASEESLVRNFLLSKPGLMTILEDNAALLRVYDAFERHITRHEAHHLLLSPEGFVAQLRRIAQKANKALAKYSGKPEYLKNKK